MADKPLVWLEGEVTTPPFSKDARIEAGGLLRRLQRGEALGMPHSRPMPNIGKRCHELRIVDADVTWRIVYYIGMEAIVILDVFGKKTPTTPAQVVAAAKKRLKLYQNVAERG
jgi:phage-related protein